jgi:hypothetical protein
MKHVFSLLMQSLLSMILMSCHHEAVHAKSLINVPQVSIQIVDQYGSDLPTFQHRGRTYVMGEYGERYQIKVSNLEGDRIEAVVTVDGRDVINGQPGAFHHRGYVINGYQSVLIDGFRQSQDQVATFRFTSPSNSYSSKMGSPQNVGVIGVAIFEENQQNIVYYPTQTANDIESEEDIYDGASAAEDDEAPSNTPSPNIQGAGSAKPSKNEHAEISSAPSRPSNRMKKAQTKSNLGTQYGESRYSASQKTTFERRSEQPSLVSTTHYDNQAGLIAKGVLVVRRQGASAFPQEEQYAPPPP